MTPAALRLTLCRFIAAHGFAPTPSTDGSVTFAIPFTSAQGNGWETFTVRTMAEARAALGY